MRIVYIAICFSYRNIGTVIILLVHFCVIAVIKLSAVNRDIHRRANFFYMQQIRFEFSSPSFYTRTSVIINNDMCICVLYKQARSPLHAQSHTHLSGFPQNTFTQYTAQEAAVPFFSLVLWFVYYFYFCLIRSSFRLYTLFITSLCHYLIHWFYLLWSGSITFT